jgi:hypothetical protein
MARAILLTDALILPGLYSTGRKTNSINTKR